MGEVPFPDVGETLRSGMKGSGWEIRETYCYQARPLARVSAGAFQAEQHGRRQSLYRPHRWHLADDEQENTETIKLLRLIARNVGVPEISHKEYGMLAQTTDPEKLIAQIDQEIDNPSEGDAGRP